MKNKIPENLQKTLLDMQRDYIKKYEYFLHEIEKTEKK
jgi:hypothetical protein